LKEFCDTIGKRILALRESRNLKRKDIANLLNISEGNLHSMENDKTNPSATALKKLTTFYGVTSDWILFGEIMKDGQRTKNSGFNIVVPDLEMAMYFSKIIEAWENGDERYKVWVMVQLDNAFSDGVVKKNKKNR
jgi:transcriptional regulator with XRE-family HTH domain